MIKNTFTNTWLNSPGSFPGSVQAGRIALDGYNSLQLNLISVLQNYD